jgi:hypothetical protein
VNSGHAFLIYQSKVNDDIDLSGFNMGWYTDTGSWKDSKKAETPAAYRLKPADAFSFGAGGFVADDAASAVYNLEFYKHFSPAHGYSYRPNAYISKAVTNSDLQKLITYFNGQKDEGYDLAFHNCAHVAEGAWDAVFGIKYDPFGVDTPRGLQAVLLKNDGLNDFDLDSIIN